MPKKADDALRARVVRYKALLKETKRTDVLTFGPMAKVLGMSARNLKLIIDGDEGFPIEQRGGEGHAWTFKVQDVLRHMISRDDAVLAKRDREAARLARLSGVSIGSAPEENGGQLQGFSPEALKAAAQTLMQVQRLKREQGELIEAEPVRLFLIEYNQRFQQEALGALGRVDPAGQLSPAMRALIEEDMRNLLVDMETRLQAWMVNRFADRPGAA